MVDLIEVIAKLLPLLPAAVALVIGLAVVARRPLPEKVIVSLSLAVMALSVLGALALVGASIQHPGPRRALVGPWLASGDYTINLELLIDRLSSGAALVVSLFCLLTARFSAAYMHREAGFSRFFGVLCLFHAGMLLLVMGGNLVMTFAGWEAAGLCSYLLISFYYERKSPARAGTRAILMNRVGDAAFLAAIFLAFTRFGAIDYAAISERAGSLGPASITPIAACLLVAAFAKSGQLPFSPWLARAMEGPTPSSALFYGAVMTGAGVYLVARVSPLIDASPVAGGALLLIGGATALYAGFVSLAQPDVKSGLVFSTMAQLGLMFVACGLGAYRLALIHLLAHALVRFLQLLTAPSALQTTPRAPAGHAPSRGLTRLALPLAGGLLERPAGELARPGSLYAPALHRLWLEEIIDRFIANPIVKLGNWLSELDAYVIDRAAGAERPLSRSLSAAAWEDDLARIERAHAPPGEPGRRPQGYIDHEIGRAAGIVGRLLQWTATAAHGFERHLVGSAIGRGLPVIGQMAGAALTRVEALLERPLVAALLLLAGILAFLKGAL